MLKRFLGWISNSDETNRVGMDRKKTINQILLCYVWSELVSMQVPLFDYIRLLQREFPCYQEALKELYKDARNGEPLSAALRKHPDSFCKLVVDSVDRGEQDGSLDATLKKASEELEASLVKRRGKITLKPETEFYMEMTKLYDNGLKTRQVFANLAQSNTLSYPPKEAREDISRRISSGDSISEAMEHHQQYFPSDGFVVGLFQQADRSQKIIDGRGIPFKEQWGLSKVNYFWCASQLMAGYLQRKDRLRQVAGS